jgi:hypothetical protein
LMIKELFLISFSNLLPFFIYLFVLFHYEKKKFFHACFIVDRSQELGASWMVGRLPLFFFLSPVRRVAESSHTFPSIHKFPTFRRADIHRETFKATSKNQPRQ